MQHTDLICVFRVMTTFVTLQEASMRYKEPQITNRQEAPYLDDVLAQESLVT